jgi:hypothetical protein
MGLHLPLHACYVAKRTMNLWVVTSCLINWITYLILDPVVNLWVQGELMSTFVSVLMSIRLSYNFFFLFILLVRRDVIFIHKDRTPRI